MHESADADRRQLLCAARACRLTAATYFALVTVAMLSVLARDVKAEAGQTSPLPGVVTSEEEQSAITAIEVQSRRQREVVKHQVDSFVTAVVGNSRYKSLAKWHDPMCPLVGGLPREQGEYVLERLSEIATAAHAPLGAENCKPNLFVVISGKPDVLLKNWRAGNRGMFDLRDGLGKVKQFLNSPRPIRVWYNTVYSSDAGMPGASGDFQTYGIFRPSRLTWSVVRAIWTEIVVIDARRAQKLTVKQLADYVAMVALAEVQLDADFKSAPTILRLFDPSAETVPQGLSDWDAALLKSLYTTEQESLTQRSQIQRGVFRTIDR